jgi:hypothetical protein
MFSEKNLPKTDHTNDLGDLFVDILLLGSIAELIIALRLE